MTNMVSKAENDAAGAQAWTVAEAKAKLGEVIERALSDGSRRKRLDEWLRNELPLRFEGRLLAIEAADADDRGEVIARREAQRGAQYWFLACHQNTARSITSGVHRFSASVATPHNI